MVMANACFLYRREAKSLRNNKPLQMKEFQIQAATSFMCQGKVPRGRPSLQTPPPAKKHCVQPGPQLDVRFDNVAHMPMCLEKKERCLNCPTGCSFWTYVFSFPFYTVKANVAPEQQFGKPGYVG
jgi:hypothetical protein